MSDKKDERREKFSFSKLDTFDKCPYQFLKKYEEKKRTYDSNIATSIGTILHKGKELIGESLIKGQKPDYDYIKEVIMNGFSETYADDQGVEHTKHVQGIHEIQDQFFEDWSAPDNKSGMNYDEKMEIYFQNIRNIEDDKHWKVFATEQEFTVPFRDYDLFGYIDRIDVDSSSNYRVTDYKSSKATYDNTRLKTPLQMFIYGLAVNSMYGSFPVDYTYDFMLLNETQKACSKGYEKRGLKKLNTLFDKIEECRETKVYEPKPSPLCYWCPYSATNINASAEYKNECPYYSLWTPGNKSYKTNRTFNPDVEKRVQNTGFDFDF